MSQYFFEDTYTSNTEIIINVLQFAGEPLRAKYYRKNLMIDVICGNL